jgi:hypothetical protein
MSDTKVVKWQEKMAAMAKAQAVNETVAGRFFSTKAGVLSYDGTTFPNNEFEGIVVASCVERHYYSKPFSPGSVESPECFGFSKAASIESPTMSPMVAHPKATKIVKADGCAGCPMDAWGSDIQGGKGKACKEVRRLALLPLDAIKGGGESIMAAPVGFLRVPILSVKNWAAYVQQLAAQGEAALGVVTRVKLVPNAKSMFAVTFDKLGSIESELTMAALFDRAEQVHAIIDFAYAANDSGEAEPKQPTKKSKF